jgi:hypothetical protein
LKLVTDALLDELAAAAAKQFAPWSPAETEVGMKKS